jgi:hypothetical protein
MHLTKRSAVTSLVKCHNLSEEHGKINRKRCNLRYQGEKHNDLKNSLYIILTARDPKQATKTANTTNRQNET